MQELLAEARPLEDIVSSELRETLVFLVQVWSLLEHASLKQLDILSIGAPESVELLDSHIGQFIAIKLTKIEKHSSFV